MSENEKKTFEAEEDPFADAPGLDPVFEWSEEAYYLVLSAKDASEIERRTDLSRRIGFGQQINSNQRKNTKRLRCA